MSKKKINCLFIGDHQVGKTKVLYKITEKESSLYSTIGYNKDSITYQSSNNQLKCTLNFIDLGGQDKIKPFWRFYLQDKDVIFLFVDLSQTVDDWLRSIGDCLGAIDSRASRTQSVYVIGNKSDLIQGDIHQKSTSLATVVANPNFPNTHFLGCYSAVNDQWRDENKQYTGITEAMASVGLQAKRAKEDEKKEQSAARRRRVRLSLSNNFFKPFVAWQCNPAWRNRRLKFRVGLSFMMTFGVCPLPFIAASLSYSLEEKLENRCRTLYVPVP